MKLRNKFLSLIGAASLILGTVEVRSLACSSINHLESYKMKVVFTGDVGVGKETIIRNLAGTQGQKTNLHSIDFQRDGVTRSIYLINTPAKFSTFSKIFLNTADVVAVVFVSDGTNVLQDIANIQEKINIVNDLRQKSPFYIIIQSFKDQQVVIDPDLFKLENFEYFVCSSKTDEGIVDLRNFLQQKAVNLSEQAK